MTEEVKQQLIDADIDLEGAMERFLNNEAMYEKFLKRFPTDQNYKKLVEAIAERNCDKAFTASHTLKGVCGNLSIQGLYLLIRDQVEYFRANKFDEGAAMMPAIEEEYDKVVVMIETLFS